MCMITSLTLACSQTLSPGNPGTSTNGGTSPVRLTISAAASVQDAMQEVKALYETVNPDVSITYNFGSSGSLAQQIAQGAPTDVFLSASQQWMDSLETQGEILEGSRQNLLLNSLVLITPLDQTAVQDFSDIATDKVNRVAIGEPKSAPVGRYAREALTSLNLFDTLQSKMVFAKDVRQVLAYVETGNVDAGLVYATDARGSEQVMAIATAPAESHPPIIYPVGVVAASQSTEAAQAFVDFLADDEAVTIFTNYGFTIAE
ncbi:MAG: molybdate ABC transporter substrate-binding protein [Cyanothece sp. SIO2G6]|nr:molybdate ABC transporter substrate-binding protein [Cyanothece sp. SIO2G6]